MASIGKGLETYLHRQATKAALNQLAEAREQAAAIKEQAQSELAQKKKLYYATTDRSQKEERQRALARAKLATISQEAQTHEQALMQVWQQTEQQLHAIASASDERRVAILEHLLRDAAEQLRGGDLTLQVSEADKPLITPAWLDGWMKRAGQALSVKSLQLGSAPAELWGGVIVTRADTNELVDNSFATRLALVQSSLRNQVFQMLDAHEKTDAKPESTGA